MIVVFHRKRTHDWLFPYNPKSLLQPHFPSEYSIVAYVYTDCATTAFKSVNHDNWWENEQVKIVGATPLTKTTLGDVLVLPCGSILRITIGGFDYIKREKSCRRNSENINEKITKDLK